MGNLGSHGSRTQSGSDVKRGLHSTFLNQTKLDKVTNNNQLLCTSSQETLPVGGIASADKQELCRIGRKSNISRFVQQTLSGPKTKQMATHTRPQQSQKFLKIERFKMETPETIHTSLQRFQRHLLPCAHTKPIKKISEILCPGQNIPIQSTFVWPVPSSFEIHCCDQRGQIDGFTKGCKDPPVPRRLVGAGQIPPNLSPTYTNTGRYLTGSRLVGKHGEIRTEPQASFRLCRLPI